MDTIDSALAARLNANAADLQEIKSHAASCFSFMALPIR
jgi:hypothetical protein